MALYYHRHCTTSGHSVFQKVRDTGKERDRALQIPKERCAKGKITKEEFDEKEHRER
jgi:uncharacterized membrane protein